MSNLIIDPFKFTAAAFDPLTAFTWDVVYWADDPGWANPGDGNPVTTWDDGSGNGRDGTAAAGPGGNSPVYRSSEAGLNNRAIVDFDTTKLTSTSFTRAQPCSVVTIFADHTNADGRLCSSTVNLQVFRDNAAPPSGFGHYAGGFGTYTPNVSSTAGALFSIYLNGASSYPVLDGTAAATADPGSTGFANLAVGYRDTGSGDLHGIFKIAFIGVTSGDFHVHANYAAFKSWVASYYGLSIA